MKLPSAKEIRNITKENIRKNALDRIMRQIISAAENGQYSIKIHDDYTEEEVDYIFHTLLDLDYNIHTKVQNYIGLPKTFTEITINWHE